MKEFDETVVRSVLSRIALAWKERDFERMGRYYVEGLLHMSDHGFLSGRDEIMQRYKNGFGNLRSKLSFKVIDCGATKSESVPHVGWAIVEWTIRIGNKSSKGMSSLTFIRQGDQFLILQDHSFST